MFLQKQPAEKRPNVRNTPRKFNRSKFFKSPRNERKKPTQKGRSDELAWFDNDAVFGFGAED